MKNPRKAPRQQRSRATYDTLVEAATRILSRDGYAAFTTNKVAEEAGISIGSLYQYFGDKTALVSEVVQRFSARILELLAKELARFEDAPLEELVRAMIRAIIAVHRVDPQLHRVLKDEVRLTPTLGAMDEYQAAVLAMLREEFQRRRHELRDMDPGLASFVLAHAVEAAVRAYVLPGGPDASEADFAEEVSLLVLGYVRPRTL